MENSSSKPVPILFDTYLALIKNSVGSRMFRQFYAYLDGQKQDLVQGGELSCAFFVSFVLHNFKLVNEPHLTVAGTEKDLTQSGWQVIDLKIIKEGSILIWESKEFDGDSHQHIGFYIGSGRAVSTDSRQGAVVEHAYDFNRERRIEKVYWTDKLNPSHS